MRTRLERLVGIEREIRAGRFPSLEGLCTIFAVKPRTMYEDIRLLRERLGLDIRFDRSRNGYYNASPSRTLPTFDLTDDEFILLLLACELLCSSLGGVFAQLIQGLVTKIRDRMPESRLTTLHEPYVLAQSELPAGKSLRTGTLFDIARACLDGRRVELTLELRTGAQNRTQVVYACCLAEKEKRWHLVAMAALGGEPQIIPLEAVNNYRVLESDKRADKPLVWRDRSFGCLVSRGETAI